MRGTNLQPMHFSVKTFVKMKELDPVGVGVSPAAPLDPPMKSISILYRIFFCYSMWQMLKLNDKIEMCGIDKEKLSMKETKLVTVFVK